MNLTTLSIYSNKEGANNMSNKQYVKACMDEMRDNISLLEDIYNKMSDNMEDDDYTFTDAIEVLQSSINAMKAYVI